MRSAVTMRNKAGSSCTSILQPNLAYKMPLLVNLKCLVDCMLIHDTTDISELFSGHIK